jgi:Mce-associated membrane protein
MDAHRPADAAVTAEAAQAAEAAETAAPWYTARRLTMALAVVLAALTATAGVLAWQLQQAHGVEERRTAVLQAASRHATNFLSVDYRQVERDTAKVLAGTTGQFRKEYAASRGRLQQLVRQNRSVSTGKVLSAGVVSADEDSARVIVVADSQVQNLSSGEPQPRHYRLQLDLARQDGQWLVSSLQFVG